MYTYDLVINRSPHRFLSGERILLGSTIREKVLGIPLSDISGHMLILGKSGTGKSNLMSLIAKDLLKREGNLVVIDPHGNLSSTIIGENRTKDFVYISGRKVNSGSGDIAVQLNPLRSDSDSIERTSGWLREIMSSDQSVSQGTWGPRLEVVFRALLPQYLSTTKDSSVPDFLDMLMNRDRMKRFVSDSRGAIRSMVSMLTGDWRKWSEYVSSSMNKVIPLLANESVKNLLSRGDESFDTGNMLRSGNSLITVDIGKGNVSAETVRIMSLLVLLIIWNRISRGSQSTGIKTYLIVDEAQNIPPGIMNTLLSEGRKFGVVVILATQTLYQMDRGLVDSVLGNVRNFASFSVSGGDAYTLSRAVPEKTVAQQMESCLRGQRLHRCIIWNQNEDGFSGPVSLIPELFPKSSDPVEVEKRIMESIQRFGSQVLEEKTVQQATPHSILVDQLKERLVKMGLRIRNPEVIGKCMPDAMAEIGSTIVVLEVELSDMQQRSRIIRKIQCYSGRRIAFVTDQDNGSVLYSMLLDFCTVDTSSGLPAEKRVILDGEEIVPRDLGDFLLRTSIIERRSGRFYHMNGTKFSPLNVQDITGMSTFEKGIVKKVDRNLRVAIYRYMCGRRVAFISIDEAEKVAISSGFPGAMVRGITTSAYIDGNAIFR